MCHYSSSWKTVLDKLVKMLDAGVMAEGMPDSARERMRRMGGKQRSTCRVRSWKAGGIKRNSKDSPFQRLPLMAMQLLGDQLPFMLILHPVSSLEEALDRSRRQQLCTNSHSSGTKCHLLCSTLSVKFLRSSRGCLMTSWVVLISFMRQTSNLIITYLPSALKRQARIELTVSS